MKITKNDVEYVARLARLALTEEEKEKYTSQLESILEYIDQLNTLDTKDIPPTSHVLPLSNVWRKDEHCPTAAETRERILNNAPEREEDFFKVKKVIE
jgi:aspartyl-tRNA(Asn)/glutamyl-tRNA(Gln) amidotransferase subunit C